MAFLTSLATGIAAVATLVLGAVAPSPAFAAGNTCTWTGAGGSPNWSTAGNWVCAGGLPETVPSAGDTIMFPSAATATATTDDIPLGSGAFASVTFQKSLLGGNWSVNGTDGLAPGSFLDATGGAFVLISSPVTVTASSTQFNASSNTDILEVSGPIAGSDATQGLQVNAGAAQGVVTLAGANTYSGTTEVVSGELDIANAGALGGGGLVQVDSGARLAFSASGTYTNPFSFGTGVAPTTVSIDPSVAVALSTGAVTLNAGTTDVAPGTNARFTAGSPIGGTGALSDSGAASSGGIFLTAANTYSGGTTISSGSASSTGVTVENSGALGSGPVTIDHGGWLWLNNVGGSGLTFANTLNFGDGASSAWLIDATSDTWSGPIKLGQGPQEANYLGVESGRTMTLAGPISDQSTLGSLTVNGFSFGGTVAITHSNTYSGSTYIENGLLKAEANSALGGTTSSPGSGGTVYVGKAATGTAGGTQCASLEITGSSSTLP
ncbi:MAG TPA: autotransporter-associated beta strand repeat-containing protein, partial [Acidimicrobiales bacterium]|nr:autotransporter-associated beta strand repeat-containing protein [Acidimicrobiales bacterium]